jgi:hypothetical protein
MRTTLTLDDDVAALLARLRKARNASHKDLVNEALRLGLKQMTGPPRRPRRPIRTRSVSLGACRIGSLDNVAEVLAVAEDESCR